MAFTIPGVELPGDLSYKNELVLFPKNQFYRPHQSRIFMLEMLGRAFTNEDARALADKVGGVTSMQYTTDWLAQAGYTGVVVPTLEFTSVDQKRTIYNWEEFPIDDTADVQITATATVAAGALTAGTEATFTVSTTAKLYRGRTIKHFAGDQQIWVSEVISTTQFRGYIIDRTFTSGSTFPGTDTQANGAQVTSSDVLLIMAGAQPVGGYGIREKYASPVQRRNAFQTFAWEFERTGHAEAEQGTHATQSTELDQRKLQTSYYSYSAIDDTMWHGIYGYGQYGGSSGDEVYFMEGLLPNIGNATAITDYTTGGGTVLTHSALIRMMKEATESSNPADIVFTGNADMRLSIEAVGRSSGGTVFVETGATVFGTAYTTIKTAFGDFRFLQLPTTKTLGDSNNILRWFNTKYIFPVNRPGRTMTWKDGVMKDGTQDAKYDVLRGDGSLAVMHRTLHGSVTGITG